MKKLFLLLFTVSLFISCSDDSTSVESESSRLVADFSFDYDTVSENDQITIVNDSEGAVSYKWDVGNGVTFTGEAPEFKFQSHGIYNITLTVENELGETHSITKAINVLCVFGGGVGAEEHTW